MLDALISGVDRGLRALHGVAVSAATFPSESDPALSEPERKAVSGMMRVNHAGEVCAQSLYEAQALFARDPEWRRALLQSAEEESEHLAWTRMRLRELNARPSLLDPLWFAGSTLIGLAVAAVGDQASKTFLRETELQVSEHLGLHLERLPDRDRRSRAILEQMRADEQAHAELADGWGALPMSEFGAKLMRLSARVMTTTARVL